MGKRWFWLANLALLLLYGWTLTEESAVRVRVEGDVCTAVFPERADITRTSSIPCPGLRGGFVGLYFDGSSANPVLDWGPLDWLAPRSAWRSVIFSETRENGHQLRIVVPEELPGWRRVWGEWRPVWETAVMRWQTPIYGGYIVTADLRRPDETAGILFLEPDGEDGWAFITTPNGRRGAWWRWRDGAPDKPLVGIPFQKSALAQIQSLLRRMLRAHQGALLLLLTAWLLAKIFGSRLTRRFNYEPKTILLLITLAVLAVTVYIAGDVLQRIPHVQDSITYLFQAEILSRGKLWADAPPLPAFFDHEFLIVQSGRWFGQYAPGFPALLAVGVLLNQPWLVNPILATLTIPLLYLLGKVMYGRSTGIIAAFLALASPFFLFMSGSMMSHPAELFWTVLFITAWAVALKSGSPRRWALLAGFALGMIVLTRQVTAVAVGLPFWAATGLGWLKFKDRSLNQSPITSPQSLTPILKKTGWLLVTAVPLAALLFIHQGVVTGHPFTDPRLLVRPFDRLGFGEDVGPDYNAFNLTLIGDKVSVDWFIDPDQPPRGHNLARGIYNLEQNWRALERQLFGWLPIFSLAFVWLALLSQRPSREDVALLAVIAGTLIVYLFFWADGIMYGPRYFYGALPAFLLLSARGMQKVANFTGRPGGRAAITFIVLLLVGGSLALYLPEQMAAHRGYNFVDAQPRIQVEAQIDGQAVVFISSHEANWWEFGRFFSGNTPWLDGRIVYARNLENELNSRLLSNFPGYTPYRWHDGQLHPLDW